MPYRHYRYSGRYDRYHRYDENNSYGGNNKHDRKENKDQGEIIQIVTKEPSDIVDDNDERGSAHIGNVERIENGKDLDDVDRDFENMYIRLLWEELQKHIIRALTVTWTEITQRLFGDVETSLISDCLYD